jgi:hypothetical protein
MLAASEKSAMSTVIDTLAGVASVSGQKRRVARTNPRKMPSSGRK